MNKSPDKLYRELQLKYAKTKALADLLKKIGVEPKNISPSQGRLPISFEELDGGNTIKVEYESHYHKASGVIQHFKNTYNLKDGKFKLRYEEDDSQSEWVHYITKPEGHKFSTENWPSINQITKY